MLENLHERISSRRQIHNLSQTKLAQLAGISVDGLSHIEQGRRKDPRISTIIKIAKVFNMTVDELLAPEKPLELE